MMPRTAYTFYTNDRNSPLLRSNNHKIQDLIKQQWKTTNITTWEQIRVDIARVVVKAGVKSISFINDDSLDLSDTAYKAENTDGNGREGEERIRKYISDLGFSESAVELIGRNCHQGTYPHMGHIITCCHDSSEHDLWVFSKTSLFHRYSITVSESEDENTGQVTAYIGGFVKPRNPKTVYIPGELIGKCNLAPDTRNITSIGCNNDLMRDAILGRIAYKDVTSGMVAAALWQEDINKKLIQSIAANRKALLARLSQLSKQAHSDNDQISQSLKQICQSVEGTIRSSSKIQDMFAVTSKMYEVAACLSRRSTAFLQQLESLGKQANGANEAVIGLLIPKMRTYLEGVSYLEPDIIGTIKGILHKAHDYLDCDPDDTGGRFEKLCYLCEAIYAFSAFSTLYTQLAPALLPLLKQHESTLFAEEFASLLQRVSGRGDIIAQLSKSLNLYSQTAIAQYRDYYYCGIMYNKVKHVIDAITELCKANSLIPYNGRLTTLQNKIAALPDIYPGCKKELMVAFAALAILTGVMGLVGLGIITCGAGSILMGIGINSIMAVEAISVAGGISAISGVTSYGFYRTSKKYELKSIFNSIDKSGPAAQPKKSLP